MPNIHDARATYGASLAFVPTRDELPIVLNQRGLFGCGVEVGVKEGDFSEHLLRGWAGAHLISVDPWLQDDAAAYVDIANVPQAQHERFYERTRRRLAAFGDRSTIWRTTSLEAAARVPRHSLDFVYVDARHDYASVLEDLAAWYDRVRPGGILAGHDYVDGRFPAGDFGVRSAVDEFFGARGLAVYPTLLDEPWLTWMVELPRPSWTGAALDAADATDATDVTHAADAAEVPEPAAAPAPAPQSERTVSLTLNTARGPRELQLRLDPARLTERCMLDVLSQHALYEPETSQFLASVLRPGDTVADVGTHVGWFSVLAGALVGPGGRVVSFEPEAENFARLERNLALNGFAQVTPVHAAVGAAEGTAEFHVNADNDGGHALWEVGRHDFNRASRERPETRTVPVTTLDAHFPADMPAPRVVKVDAEGCEHLVVQGGEALLRRGVPYVVCEINRFALAQMGTSEAALRAHMTALGYETFVFVPGSTELPALAPDQTVQSDYVFNLLFRHPAAAAA